MDQKAIQAVGFDLFNTLITVEKGALKDAVESLLKSLHKSGKEMIYVGDDPEADITGAFQSGLRPVWSTYVRDHGLPFAPGYDQDGTAPGGKGVPRISDWAELTALLDGGH